LMQLGETAELSAVTNLAEEDIQNIVWSPDDESIDCLDCFDVMVSPTENTVYQVSVTDVYGCVQTDALNISVDDNIDVMIPTAFSPNGDGNNDFFRPYSNSSLVEVQSFAIYDRWGNNLYYTENLSMSGLSGWDGTYNNQNAEVGAYTFVALISLNGDEPKIFKGNVTLVR